MLHPGATLSSFTTRRGRAKAGPGDTPEDYVMTAQDVAKVGPDDVHLTGCCDNAHADDF